MGSQNRVRRVPKNHPLSYHHLPVYKAALPPVYKLCLGTELLCASLHPTVKEWDVCCQSFRGASVCLSVCPSVPCVSTGLVQTTRGHRGSLRCICSAQEAGSICCDLFPPRVTQPLAPLQEHRTLLLKMKDSEAELARLRSVEGDKLAEQDR